MKKSAVVSIPLAVALAAIAYVLLARGPEPSSEPAPAPEQAGSTHLLDPAPEAGAEKRVPYATPTADRRLERESETEGDLTMFSMTHGEIGDVDVDSVLQDRNPSSVIALLKKHGELTGADESLEINH